MKTLSLLVPCLILLIFSSCDKEKFDPIKEDDNPTSYLLTSKTITAFPSISGDVYYFTYNKDYLVSEIKHCYWYNIGDANGGRELQVDTTYYDFEYSNKQCFRCNVRKRPYYKWYSIFFYDNYSRIKMQIYYDGGDSEIARTTYLYDSKNNLIQTITFKDGTPESTVILSYNDKNIVSITPCFFGGRQAKEKVEYLSFDNHVNYKKTINGLPNGLTLGPLWVDYYLSQNNYIDLKYYPPVNINKPFGQGNNVETGAIQEYNDEGLPVKQISGFWKTEYTYKKYK